MIEELLGVIHSYGISHTLVITRASIHAKRMMLGFSERPSIAYLGPRSTATEDQQRIALTLVDRINQAKFNIIERHEADKEFMAEKESIIRITMKLPGEYRVGYVILKTLGEEFKVTIAPPSGRVDDARYILNALIPSLSEFAPDRFYDEKSGKLVTELRQEGLIWHEGWGFSWKPKKPQN